MNIAFTVNQTPKELAGYTTTGLALAAHKAGHNVYYIGVGDFVYLPEGKIGAHARQVPARKFRTNTTLLEAVLEQEKKLINFDKLDILWLRNDPAADMEKRAWAQDIGILFGQLAVRQGVLVLNDPSGLVHASSKMYLQYFPEAIRPKSIITRNIADVDAFYHDQHDKIILKPLKGSGGKNVFLLDKKERKNMKQIVEAICRDGFVIAQEYLPAAQKGDTRLFLMDGEPLTVDGKIAAIRRVQQQGEVRSNIHQGAKAAKAVITKQMLGMIKTIGQKLKDDGMFLVGLDIVGNKLMEINVFSPGGLGQASELNGVDYLEAVVAAAVNKADAYRKNKSKQER